MSPARRSLSLASWILALAVIGPCVHAYIPASPANNTDPDANATSPSHLLLRWFGGGYQEDVSYQLVGADSNGISEVRVGPWQMAEDTEGPRRVLLYISRSLSFLTIPVSTISEYMFSGWPCRKQHPQ